MEEGLIPFLPQGWLGDGKTVQFSMDAGMSTNSSSSLLGPCSSCLLGNLFHHAQRG